MTVALVPPNPKELESARLHLALPGLVGNEIEIAARRGIVEVERRRDHAVIDGEDGEDQLDAAGGAQQVADGRLGRRHREPPGIGAEEALDRAQLDLVAERRRRAVRVDVVDLVGVEFRGPERVRHGAVAARAVRRRCGHVVGIAAHAVADDLGVDVGAPLLRVLVLLQHDHARTFPHHEPVARLVPRAGRALRLVVEVGGERAGRGEARDADVADARLGAARHHDVRIAPQDQVRGVADGVRPGRARGHHRVIGAAKAVADGDVARGQVDQARRDEERAEPPRPLLGHEDGRRLDGLEPADAGADHHAGPLQALVVLGLPA